MWSEVNQLPKRLYECIYNSRVGRMSKRVEIPSDGRKQEHSLLITEEEPPGLPFSSSEKGLSLSLQVLDMKMVH